MRLWPSQVWSRHGFTPNNVSWTLRRQLEAGAPGPIARSYVAATNPQSLTPVPAERVAAAMARLPALAASAQREIAGGLWGRDDAHAWDLRGLLGGDDLVRSVAGVPGERAWAVRNAWLTSRGGDAAFAQYESAHLACGAVAGLGDEPAWHWRATARAAAPVSAIASLWGVFDDRAWKWRRKWLERAPKTVLGTLETCDDPRAWELRTATWPRCPEALDSMRGIDAPAAWALRAAAAATWPAAAAKSLGPLLPTERGRDLLAALLAAHTDSLGLWRLAAQALARGAVDADD